MPDDLDEDKMQELLEEQQANGELQDSTPDTGDAAIEQMLSQGGSAPAPQAAPAQPFLPTPTGAPIGQAPAAPPGVAPVAPPPDRSALLAQILGQKYADTPEMQAAKDKRNTSQLISGIGRGFNQISAAAGGKPVSNEGYDQMDAQAKQPVTDLINSQKLNSAQQQAAIKSYLTGTKLDLTKNALQNTQVKNDETNRHNQVMEDLRGRFVANSLKKSQNQPSAGQKAVDIATGKDYADYAAGGGYAKIQSTISKLRDVQDQLKKDPKSTGGYANYLPDSVRATVDPTGLSREQEVHSAILGNLKQIFGGKVTEDQMRIFLKKSYDPRLPSEENVKKLDAAINEMQEKAAAKEHSMQYFEKNGSLKGYQGQVPDLGAPGTGGPPLGNVAQPPVAQSAQPPPVPAGMKLQKNKATGEYRVIPQ